MAFIKLTHIDEKPVLVNPDLIHYIVAVGEKGTKISFGKRAVWVQESIEAIESELEKIRQQAKK